MMAGPLANKERVRRLIVELVFIIYWLLIFEGALRKWIFPQYSTYIFFIRDPFVLVVYWFAWTNGMWPKRIPIFSYGVFLSVIFGLFALVQIMHIQFSPIVILYGWRNYFYYLPLVFIIGESFRGEDLKRLIRHTLLITIPIAALIYLQVNSPVRSFINRSVVEDVFYTESGAAGGRVIRATGTFTFFHGHQLFMGSIIAFIFVSWILPKKERPLSGLPLYLASIAVAVIFGADLTRLPIFLAAFVLIATFFSGVLIRRKGINIRSKIIPIVLIILILVVVVNFFEVTQEIRIGRFGDPDTKSRIPGIFSSFMEVLSVPFLGYGIGFTTRGAEALGVRAGVNVPCAWAGEDEWRRIMSEVGPLFGVIYISYRIMLAVWLSLNAVKATYRSNNPLPLLMISYIGVIIIVWYMTTIGTVHGYGWLFAGFCAAANRLGQTTPEGKRGVWS